MTTSAKQQDLDRQLPLMGVDRWRNQNYNKRTINVWNIENDAGHGACTGQIVLDVNPYANVYFGAISGLFDSEKILDLTVHDDKNGIDFKGVSAIEDFIKKYNIDIITSSQKGFTHCKEWNDLWVELVKKYNLVICQCAANEGYNPEDSKDTTDAKFPTEISHVVAALEYINYASGAVIQRANYSSVGEDLDFAQLVLWYSGTSAATPALAGQVSMIMQRYGKMSLQESHQYLKMISTDLDIKGHDKFTGWGMPVLPNWDKKYITMTTKSNTYYVDGEAKTMDTKPINKEGRIFVPIRVISESLGAEVQWEFNADKSIKVTITKGNNIIVLNTGNEIAYINGKKIYIDVAPFIDSNNRTLVPIRFLAECLNCRVDWIQSEAKVQILEV